MIPFMDLKAQYSNIRSEINAAISTVLESSQFVLGDEVSSFEKEFATYNGVQYGIGVNSGTSALHLALLAGGIGKDDEVITVPFTFVATVAAICYTGAKPIFVDIEQESYSMDVNQIEDAITENTKAIMPVHLYGHSADMDPILKIAHKYGLLVIEDAAQAHAAEYKGKRVGSLGDLGCFSFYPGKNLGAYGEGGMVVTNNSEYFRKIRMLRDWGQEQKYHHVLKGYNYRMEGIQGAILRVKLRHLDNWTVLRRAHASQYNEMLSKIGIQIPEEKSHAYHVYHVYAIRVNKRDDIQRRLQNKGIQTGIHYPIPVHLQQAYSDLGYKLGDFPNAEKVAAEELSLPMYPELTEDQIQFISESLKEIL